MKYIIVIEIQGKHNCFLYTHYGYTYQQGSKLFI